MGWWVGWSGGGVSAYGHLEKLPASAQSREGRGAGLVGDADRDRDGDGDGRGRRGIWS